MSGRACPWWLGYLLAHPLRRRIHPPDEILGPFVSEGMTVLEPGPGMGFFTMELARRVGPTGRVVAVDVQSRMLAELDRRAGAAGVRDRLDLRQAGPLGMGIGDLEGAVDFVLAFAVVHEMPGAPQFFEEAATALKENGILLFVEPRMEVSEPEFQETLQAASEHRLRVISRPSIRWSRAAVLEKTP